MASFNNTIAQSHATHLPFLYQYSICILLFIQPLTFFLLSPNTSYNIGSISSNSSNLFVERTDMVWQVVLSIHPNGFAIRYPDDSAATLSVAWSPFSLVQACRLHTIQAGHRHHRLALDPKGLGGWGQVSWTLGRLRRTRASPGCGSSRSRCSTTGSRTSSPPTAKPRILNGPAGWPTRLLCMGNHGQNGSNSVEN